MKTAVYIEDGVSQIVLTPESDFEQDVLKRFLGDREPGLYGASPITASAEVSRGTFYHCGGGWMRQGADPTSLIIRLAPLAPTVEPQPEDA